MNATEPIPQSKERVAATSPIKVWIATPLRKYDGPQDLPPQIGRALRDLDERKDVAFRVHADKYEFEFVAVLGGVIRGRNAVVHDFLKDEAAQFLLWWDADIFPDDGAVAVLRLLSHRQPVIGGLYVRRGGKRPQFVVTWFPEAKLEPNAEGAIQVVELGGGFKCYHRKVFTELRRLFPKLVYIHRETGEKCCGFYQHVIVDGDDLSEDYWMDLLCRKVQIGILADTELKVAHVDGDGTSYPEKGKWPPIPCLEDQP